MTENKITNKTLCDTCKHGYFADFDCTGEHNLCGAGNCYLCVQSFNIDCDDYEKGKPEHDSEM